MRGSAKVISVLNKLLAEELAAIHEFMVHAKMCHVWRYRRLEHKLMKRAEEEMHHASKLISRIVFLEGTPDVSSMNVIKIGATVQAQIDNDEAVEDNAVKDYNAAIAVCANEGDDGTVDLLEKILDNEESHLKSCEAMQTQIKDMGLQQFLAEQIKK